VTTKLERSIEEHIDQYEKKIHSHLRKEKIRKIGDLLIRISLIITFFALLFFLNYR
jgi:hypothetical protein